MGAKRVNPKYDFVGQVAVVTGASSGMGFATARAFAESGASVVLVDINADALARAQSALVGQGRQIAASVCDVSDEAQVAEMISQTVDRFGRLDMAFNSAGIINPPRDTADETADRFDHVLDVNTRGTWACMKHELRQMRAQGSGAIVNCASLAGLVGGARRATYHASKHAVVGLTKSAAIEYAARGIRINVVCPGTIETPMVDDMVAAGELSLEDAVMAMPIARIGRAEEIAAAVLWLCSPGASFVIGVSLPVDGGFVAQ